MKNKEEKEGAVSESSEIVVATQADGSIKLIFTGNDNNGLPRGSVVTETSQGTRIVLGSDILLHSLLSRQQDPDEWNILLGFDDLQEKIKTEAAEQKKNLTSALNNAAATAGAGPCWEGYKQVGFKVKDGKRVPNCVPVDSADASPQEAELAASRPAPKKDRIYGSKRNPKGSASGGRKIRFSAKTEASLRKKVAEHNEKAPKGRRATLAQLKAVYRRGSGAFSSSHRPGKTRDQWAMARVNAYLKLLRSGRPSNPNYKQDNDLLPRAHPRSSKGKTASAVTAGSGGNEGYYTPAEQDLARSLVEIADTYGKFDLSENGIWVGYESAAENEDAAIGVKCENCMLYRSNDSCAILSFKIEDNAKCRFAIFPAGAVTAKNPTPEDVQAVEAALADAAYDESQLRVELLPYEEYADPEDALLALAEFSGRGYELLPALRASWLRAVAEGGDPYSRAAELAVDLRESRDADLLPRMRT